MAASLGKNHGTVSGLSRGSVSGQGPGSLPGKKPGNSSGPLGRHDLIRRTQAILLQFPLKEAAELQDATTKAVESQRNGDSAMSLLAVAKMCQGSAKARALFAPLFGFTGAHTDPDFMQGMEMLAHSYMRQQLEKFGAPKPSAAIHGDDNSSDCAGGDQDDLTGDLFSEVRH
jgi:hypothetical protein